MIHLVNVYIKHWLIENGDRCIACNTSSTHFRCIWKHKRRFGKRFQPVFEEATTPIHHILRSRLDRYHLGHYLLSPALSNECSRLWMPYALHGLGFHRSVVMVTTPSPASFSRNKPSDYSKSNLFLWDGILLHPRCNHHIHILWHARYFWGRQFCNVQPFSYRLRWFYSYEFGFHTYRVPSRNVQLWSSAIGDVGQSENFLWYNIQLHLLYMEFMLVCGPFNLRIICHDLERRETRWLERFLVLRLVVGIYHWIVAMYGTRVVGNLLIIHRTEEVKEVHLANLGPRLFILTCFPCFKRKDHISDIPEESFSVSECWGYWNLTCDSKNEPFPYLNWLPFFVLDSKYDGIVDRGRAVGVGPSPVKLSFNP